MSWCVRWLVIATLVLLGSNVSLLADEPLHEEVDRLVAAKFGDRKPADIADDAEFLRRIYLDLAGRIPTADEARKFLDDSSARKRVKLIDRLLAAPTYAGRMEQLFHVMLMERRGDDPQWRSFLHSCFQQNRPWDEIVRKILDPDAEKDTSDEATHGAGFFLTKRLEHYGQNPIDYPGLTRDVGRLFMGVDLQCAECHDHLFIDDYTQIDFKGLFVVYKNLSIRKDVKFPAVSEKMVSEKLEFVSVFDPTKRKTGPRLPFGKQFPLPEQPKKMEADENEKNKAEGGPEFSALNLIAKEISKPDNELFSKNIVNRLWFVMMGRGLVDPLDLFHTANPPSHPKLLDHLAGQFVNHQFDMKWLLRELALTETYQRTGLIPDNEPVPPTESYLIGNEKRLSAEQLFVSTLVATGNWERFNQPGEEGEPNEAFDDLKAQFLKAFANEAREPETDFNASVKGALFLLNDADVLGLLKAEEGNLIERLSKVEDLGRVVDELFLSILTRRPKERERAAVADYLQSAEQSEKALGHVAWSMLTSMEFYVNH